VNTLNWDPGNTDYNLYFGGGTGREPHTDARPLFNNALAGDFTLQFASPAINSGIPNTPASVCRRCGLRGQSRILGGESTLELMRCASHSVTTEAHREQRDGVPSADRNDSYQAVRRATQMQQLPSHD